MSDDDEWNKLLDDFFSDILDQKNVFVYLKKKKDIYNFYLNQQNLYSYLIK